MTATPSWTTSHCIDHHKVPSQVSNILEMNGQAGGGRGGEECEIEPGMWRTGRREQRADWRGEFEKEQDDKQKRNRGRKGGGEEGSKLI